MKATKRKFWWKVSKLNKSVNPCLESPNVITHKHDIETCMT